MYKITVDHGRRIVRVQMSGFFDPTEVAAFARDEQAAAKSLGCPSGAFGLLLETPGAMPQSQEVVAAFRRLLSDLPLKAGRVAIVSEGALVTMQVRRIMTAERTGVFDRVEDALAWIADGLAQAGRQAATPASPTRAVA